MGEHEERAPGEVVETYRAPCRLGGDPREVVEVYRQPDRREVVEVYTRPLPVKKEPPKPPIRRKRLGKRGLWVFAACLALVTALAVGSRLWEDRLPAHGKAENVPAEAQGVTIPSWPVGQGAVLTVARTRGEPLTAQEVYRRLNPAVVTVRCWTGEGGSVGTGVIFTEDGYILTNYHVIRGGHDCSAVLDNGYSLTVCYVAGDEDSDLAILKIPQGELQSIGPLPVAPFGDSEQMVIGDTVYAIGAPRQLPGTLTNGIISGIDRSIEVEGRGMTLLQTNAALNSGNSGGPLISESGQVIGINVAKYMSGRESVEGMGFAIPTAQMERIVNDLLEWGELQPEPLLGVTVKSLSAVLGEDVQGLLVDGVSPGGAAEAAGVQAGDHILTAAGEPLYVNEDLLRVRRRLHLGDELTMTLERDGKTLEVTLELTEAVE